MSDDTIDPLPESIEIERVIDDESGKVFTRKATLLFLDDVANDASYADCEVEFENPVPVKADGKVIGYATLSLEGKVVEAELFLKYDCPERLTIETKSTPVYAHFTSFESYDGESVLYANITEVELSSEIPPDSRLGAL